MQVMSQGSSKDFKSRIVSRTIKVGFHNGHALTLRDRGRWVEAQLIESEEDDLLMLPPDLARYMTTSA